MPIHSFSDILTNLNFTTYSRHNIQRWFYRHILLTYVLKEEKVELQYVPLNMSQQSFSQSIEKWLPRLYLSSRTLAQNLYPRFSFFRFAC